jgi:hypothetical protein
MAFDPDATAATMVAALKGEITAGWGKISGLARSQSSQLARQAAVIIESRIAGSLRTDEALYEFFVRGLRENARNFARTVAAMTIATLDRAWNAVVGALWSAINGALTGAGLAALPIPAAPKP